MTDQPALRAEIRQGHGSQSARQLRRSGRLPGTLYGHGDPQSIQLDAHEFTTMIKPAHYGSGVVKLTLDGADAGMAMVKAVQVDTRERRVLNVDLQRVVAADRVMVHIPVILEGEPGALRAGGVLELVTHTIALRAAAFEVPDQITVDVSHLEIGDAIHAGQLALPPGCELLIKPDEVVALMAAPRVQVLEEGEVAPEAAGPELTGEKQQDDFPPER